ncbi:MAG: metallophosphoesterase [Clostridia bacterium]|nr:metallophosphoesterase [Clostridia bacterium]
MRRKIPIIIIIAAVLAFLIAGLYNELKIASYTLRSAKVERAIRIAFLSDLHSCNYGENAQTLVSAIERQQPDLVLLGGDIFDDVLPDDNAEALLRQIGGRYPCYYVTGNHEYWSGTEAFARKMRILEENHVTRLNNEAAAVTVQGVQINICGVNDPEAARIGERFSFNAALENIAQVSANRNFTLLISHRPERIDDYAKYPFDLVLAGHAHGGQWRIPHLINGVYAPNQGFFPKYAGGMYMRGDTCMIVGRGLARESTRIPRFFNRPELVIIDIIPQ